MKARKLSETERLEVRVELAGVRAVVNMMREEVGASLTFCREFPFMLDRADLEPHAYALEFLVRLDRVMKDRQDSLA